MFDEWINKWVEKIHCHVPFFQFSVTFSLFSPPPSLAPGCLEKIPTFPKHLLLIPGTFPWAHWILHKNTRKKISLFPFCSWRNWVSERLRALSHIWIIEPELKCQPSVVTCRSFHQPLRLAVWVSQRTADSHLPDFQSGFSAPGEWISCKSILDTVIIL
jgi:hypothetical protein